VDDLLRYFKRIRQRQASKATEKLVDYYMMLSVYHTEKPQEIADSLKGQIDSIEETKDTGTEKQDSRLYKEDADLSQIDRLRRFREEKGLQ
jgi:hypothetical protein